MRDLGHAAVGHRHRAEARCEAFSAASAAASARCAPSPASWMSDAPSTRRHHDPGPTPGSPPTAAGPPRRRTFHPRRCTDNRSRTSHPGYRGAAPRPHATAAGGAARPGSGGVESTPATWLSWTDEEQRQFSAEFREHLRSQTEVQLAMESRSRSHESWIDRRYIARSSCGG
jgi:hypothetical protein